MKKLLLLTTLFIASLSNAQSWQNLGSSGIVSPNVLDIISQLTIVVSSESVPYICGTDSGNFSQPTVKKLNGNAWVNVGTSINNDQVASNTSIALDSNNVPYVAFLDFDASTGTNTGYVKKFDGTNWVLVGSLGFVNASVGDIIIKIDNNNVPYVSYNTYFTSENVVVKKFDGTNWNSLGSITTNSVFYYDFELDNNNIPFVIYDGVVGQDVVLYAKKFNGTTWANVGAGAIINLAASKPSIAFDSTNTPNVAFLSGNNPDLVVKKFNGINWVNVGNTVASINIENPKIAIGPNNIAVVCYKDLQNGEIINVKKLIGSTWNLITTPTSFDVIDNNLSLAIGNNNIPYIAYNTPTNIKAKFYGTSLATNQNQVKQDLQVFPNPISDFLNINSINQINQVTIYDMLGNKVFETNKNCNKIELSNLESGFYIAIIKTNLEQIKIKLTKL